MYQFIPTFLISFILISPSFAQKKSMDPDELFDLLKAKDSLVFNIAFNNCDTALFRILLSEDLEFYHDQSGFSDSKEMFIQSFPNLCQMNYKPIRVLADNSLQVFPLHNNDRLYGAIQTGIHEFYGMIEGKPRYLTSTAKFTHVWILEKGDWKLKRILSYDHMTPVK